VRGAIGDKQRQSVSMSRGRYLSLEEARQRGLLERFAKEHPSEGDESLFDRLLEAMARSEPPKSSKAAEKT
jgi:hypothetical protein